MCGIAGALNLGRPLDWSRSTSVQSHRGPDDAGEWNGSTSSGESVFLGSRRLAILDLSPAGHMPMSTPDGMLTLTYNGELYNAGRLRAGLESKGYKFRSHSDTEVVLYSFQEYGIECLQRFNGMFAFAVWDARSEQMFLARDHFGIKPLYYFHRGSQLAFASEIKALLELSAIPREIDFHALHQYLTFLWVPEPLTLFKGILKLPAGHYATFRRGELSVTKYWDLEFPAADHCFRGSEAELATEVRDRITSAVESQMISDVPLGAFLSAGLDSSSIVAAMARKSTQPVRTFTIAFPEKYRRGEVTLDDNAVAKRTAEHFGCIHREIMVEPSVSDLLPKLVWHMDEPTADPAIITAYLVNREARRDATVLLSGVGGDEVFGGYRKYQAHYLAEKYRRIPEGIRKNIVEPSVAALPSFRGTTLKGYVRLAKKMTRSGSLPSVERFLMDSVYMNEPQKKELYSSEMRARVTESDPMCEHRRHFQSAAHAYFLNQMLYVDSKTFMVSLNLNYNDKMSMASSVEVRVPFLDRELTEWTAMNVPPAMKIRNGVTKHILREAMRPVLPAEVLTQRKAGFAAPIDYWLANELRPMTDDLLSDSRVKDRGIFDSKVVRRYVAEHRSGRQDWSAQIWQLLTLELWMQTFMNSEVSG